MVVRHHHSGKVYIIQCPPGSRVRRSEAAGESVIYVPTEDGEVPVFEKPGELLVRLGEMAKYGLRLLHVEDEPES